MCVPMIEKDWPKISAIAQVVPRFVNPAVLTPSQLVSRMTLGYRPVVIKQVANTRTWTECAVRRMIYPIHATEMVRIRHGPLRLSRSEK